MKKLVLLFAVVLAALVAACGAAPEPTKAPAPVGSTTAASPSTPAPLGPGAGMVKGAFDGEARALNGAGATFPAVLYTKWFNEYEKVTGVKVNYQAVGSGGGIKSIQDTTVDFGATDGPMSADQEKAAKGGAVLHVPMALGAVVPTYNVPEAKSSLRFSAETLSGIFLGTITKWNDPKLVADNPDLASVNKDIVTVHRADGSGTTFIWTDYLSAVSADWKSKVGSANSVNWPNGLGGQGNAGVAGEVKNSPYSIGYVELIYALQNKLGYGDVKNKTGKFITPSIDSVTAAASGVEQSIPADLKASIVNAEGDRSYPISGFTWLLIYQNQTDKAKGIAVARLAWWSIYDGQKYNRDLGYAPLPDGIVAKGADKIKSIKLPDGTPAFPGK
ncbi:MAG: phosphate ABC transporter substrate-binding protein PstS [Chloroflexi bacterium]|nr:phosphate ABC transporter substrate-binding protein PstS [Chloroflexota bacterium]